MISLTGPRPYLPLQRLKYFEAINFIRDMKGAGSV